MFFSNSALRLLLGKCGICRVALIHLRQTDSAHEAPPGLHSAQQSQPSLDEPHWSACLLDLWHKMALSSLILAVLWPSKICPSTEWKSYKIQKSKDGKVVSPSFALVRATIRIYPPTWKRDVVFACAAQHFRGSSWHTTLFIDITKHIMS